MKILNYLTGKTLKSKLTTLFIALIIFIGISFFVISTLVTRATLHNQIDHHIHIVVLEAHRIIETYSGEERLTILRNLVSSQGMTIVLLSADGSPILQTNSPDVAAVSEHQLQKIMLQSSLASEPEHFTVDTIRFASLPVNLETGNGILAVGYSTLVITQTQKILLASLGLTLIVVLSVSILIIVKLLNKMLQPLTMISQTALGITHSNELSNRVSDLPSTEELKKIAEAFNTMLERLQAVFHTEHTFFADAAHTLKTPLAVLRSQIETSPSLSEKKKKQIFSVIDNAAETIKQLLFISQIETQNIIRKKVSLSSLLNQLVELAETLASSKTITVKSRIDKNVTVIGDKALLIRALSNLVKNSIEHTEKGSINIELHEKSDSIEVLIQDTGKGIKKSDLPKIFDRFYKGDKAKKSSSTGLGLAITQAIINKHGAQIKISSKVDEGTEVLVVFPN